MILALAVGFGYFGFGSGFFLGFVFVFCFLFFFFFIRCVVVDKGERWPVVMAGGGGCWFGGVCGFFWVI